MRQSCELMVVQQALALATAELWLGGLRGVRNLQAEHLLEDVCKLLLKKSLAEDPLGRLDD